MEDDKEFLELFWCMMSKAYLLLIILSIFSYIYGLCLYSSALALANLSSVIRIMAMLFILVRFSHYCRAKDLKE